MLQIKTDRLSIYLLNEDHVSLIQALRKDELVNFYQTRKVDGSLESAMAHIHQMHEMVHHKTAFKWVIQINESKDLIGTICYWNFSEDRKEAEIGYELLPDFWKKGYLSELLPAFLSKGFDAFNLNTIHGYTSENNQASIKLLNKFDFKQDEKFKSSSGLLKFSLERKFG